MKHLLMAGLVLLAGWSCSQFEQQTTSERPNIILIMADDLGYETIGANGGTSYQTPKIDRIASKGIRFEHCYAQPLCTPSRVKLMTGMSNVRNYVDFGILDQSQTTFGHLFKDAGYSTCIVGKWQLGKDRNSPYKAGFDNHCLWQVDLGATDSTGRDTRYSIPLLQVDGEPIRFDSSAYGPKIAMNYAIKFIEKSVEDNQPFLLYYPMILPHCPFSPTPSSPEWDTDDTTVMKYKGQAHYFEDMIHTVDDIVGTIESRLQELGIENNTLLIFTGDNGTDRPIVSMLNGREVKGSKRQTTDAGTRVPLIAKWPGVIDEGAVSSELIDFSDFFPTISELALVDIPDSLDLDGVSFASQLRGEKGETRDWVYSWFIRNQGDTPRVYARNQQYKLYSTGEFYEVPVDYYEERPINIDELDSELQSTYDLLDSVISQYEGKRLNAITKAD